MQMHLNIIGQNGKKMEGKKGDLLFDLVLFLYDIQHADFQMVQWLGEIIHMLLTSRIWENTAEIQFQPNFNSRYKILPWHFLESFSYSAGSKCPLPLLTVHM